MNEKAENTMHGLALDFVRRLHSPRSFSGDGYGWTLCAEDRQRWPCSTEQGIREVLGETDAT